MTTTPKLGLEYIASGQDARLLHNVNMNKFDAEVFLCVKDRNLNAPPSASEGDVYLIASSPTGVWTGHAGKIAQYIGGAWKIYTPQTGWRAWVEDEATSIVYLSSSWKTITGESIFSARDAAGGLTVNGSWANVPWNTEDRNDAIFTHDNSTNPDQITLVEAGDYEVTVSITVLASATTANNQINTKLVLGGVDVAGSFSTGNIHYNTFPQVTITFTKIANATAGQVLQAAVVRASGTSTIATVAGYSRIHIRRV